MYNASMITIDQLLNSVCTNIKLIQSTLPAKDRRIMLSLSKQLSQGNFLTESQAKLLVKILDENKSLINTIEPNVVSVLDSNRWTTSFRVIQQNREISIVDNNTNLIKVGFTYNKRLKEKLHELNAELVGGITASINGYGIQLTEENILLLVNKFKNDNFVIDPKIINFYHEITKIHENTKNPFTVFDLENKHLKKCIEEDIGEITQDNLLLLHDRKFRYQYTVTEKITEKSLKINIAQRDGTKVFIDSTCHSLTDVMKALKDLKRLPALIVFEGHLPFENKHHLDLLAKSLEDVGIVDEVGIYFRFDTAEDTGCFNSTVAQLQYNKPLSSTTVVAGIANNKIPKFMIKTGWKPSTVITFTNGFKNNKSYVYCSDVDLIIYWGNKQPMHGDVHAIV